MKILITILSFLFLYGCTTVKMFDQEGKVIYGTKCDGASWIPCYKSAGRTCKEQGYEIIEKTSTKEHTFFTSDDSKQMIFRCK